MADKPYVLNKLENAVYLDGDTPKDFSGNTLEFGKQPDWNQTDTTALDYVKNKPTIDTDITSGSTNAVTGNAIYTALAGKANTAMSYELTLEKEDFEGLEESNGIGYGIGGYLPFDEDSTLLITLSQSATDEQVEACKNAKLYFEITGPGSIVIIMYGVKSTVDVPLVITMI